LVVARRVLDSLTPGWQQVGAVWLPLPHVLNILPVQVDAWYRTGASAIALSVVSMALAVWALADLLRRTTGSVAAGVAGAVLMLGNGNVLYLQSAPMTEPQLFGTCMLAVALTARWVERGAPLPPRAAGWAIVAACMTRYEAWPVCGALIVLAGLVLLRQGCPAAHAFRGCARLAVYPAVALVLFSANSRWTTGTWFVPSGFFVPDPESLGSIGRSWEHVRHSVYALSGTAWVWPAYAGTALIAGAFAKSRRHAPLVLLVALAAAACVPGYAYYQGHPVRLRYGLPLVIACAALAAAGLAVLPVRLRGLAAAAVVAWALVQAPPLGREILLVTESLRDRDNRQGREVVTDYLRQHWDRTPVMMSMGSLAHYMHDLSAIGLNLRDFLHEGNEYLWMYSVSAGPQGFVRWVIIEEYAEGGDALYQAAARNPQFFRGFQRVAEGGGVALYRDDRLVLRTP